MADFGLKVARAGFDVRTCADYELLFNSAWPSLAVAVSTTQPGAYSSNTWSFSFSHGLGFVPFALGWVIQNGKTSIDKIFPSVTNQTVSYTYSDRTAALSPSDTVTFYIVCYNLDITQSASYAFNPPAAAAQPYDSRFGIKISKDGKDINSTDMRDYILHSRCQSPAVLGITVNATSPISYTMPAGYTVWTFAYFTSDGVTWIHVPLDQQTPPFFTIDSSTFTLSFLESDQASGSIVVLRDPLFAASTVGVTY